MNVEMEKVEAIIDEHKSYLTTINEAIIEGISEGVKEGVAEGLKRGAKDGLEDCLTKGLMNIGQDDIGDILADIPEEMIKNSLKEGARYIFEKSTEQYLQRICQKLVDGIQKEDIKLSQSQAGHVSDLVKRGEQEALKKVVERLPNNLFFKEAVAGMLAAWEESLEERLKACEERIRKEIADKS